MNDEIERLEEIIERVSTSARRALEEAKEIYHRLEGDRKIWLIDEGSFQVPNSIAGIDGSFKSVIAFVNPLTIIRVVRVLRKNNSYDVYSPFGNSRARLFYQQDYRLEDESLLMLYREAKTAYKALEEADYVFIDGPFINPPIDVKIESKTYEENMRLRLKILESNKAMAFVKRMRKTIITRHYKVQDISETVLVIKLLQIIREGGHYGPIAIGPFKVDIHPSIAEGVPYRITYYQRYLQRSPTHKVVVLETKEDRLNERIFDERVRVNDLRAEIPNVIQLAHELSKITDDEASGIYSAVYRALKFKSGRAFIEPFLCIHGSYRIRTKPR